MKILGTTKSESDREMQIGIIPFGKYKGKRINDPEVDILYLVWMFEKVHNLNKELKELIDKEIRKRELDIPCFGHYNPDSRGCRSCKFLEHCVEKSDSYEETDTRAWE